MYEIECAHWEWYDVEGEGDGMYTITKTDEVKLYMLASITNGTRQWTPHSSDALIFTNAHKVHKYIKEYLPNASVIVHQHFSI